MLTFAKIFGWPRAGVAALLVFLIAAAAACSGGSPILPKSYTQLPPPAVGARDPMLRGQVVLPREAGSPLHTQATTGDVVNNALVSIIDPTTNLAIATGLTDASGNFAVPPPAESTFATANTIYILDATKGLPFPRPNFPPPTPTPTPTPLNFAAGAKAPRMRTLALWNGTVWTSITACTASGTNYNYITPDTTALSIIISERGYSPANAIGKIAVTSGCGTATPKISDYAGQNEEQTITITGAPTGGTFTISFGGNTTAGIAYNATAATVQTAFTGLASVGAGNATVTGAAGGPYTITFTGALGAANQAQVTTNSAGLTGGTSPAAVPATATNGFPNTLDTDISTFIEGAVKTLVNTVLQTNEDDPVAMIVYRNGTYINRKSTTVNLGANVSTLTITGATISNPRGITFDGGSNLYLVQDSATAGADTILQINKSTGAACILVIGTSQTGNCSSFANACSSCATNVAMTSPEYIAYDTGRSSSKTGFLYFSDPGNVTIKQVDMSALTSSGGTTAVTALATSTNGLTTPRGLVYDGGDFIYFVQPNEIWRLSLAVPAPSPNPCVLASKNTGACTCGGVPGTTCKDSALPELQDPRGITFDQANNLLYVSSWSRNDVSIYNLNKPGQDLSSLGFSSASTGYTDGNNSLGKMGNPNDVYYDGGSFIYVADKVNHVIRLVDLKEGVSNAAISTYAGKFISGNPPVGGNTNGVGLAAQFNLPAYLTFDSTTLYVSDTGNNSIRKVQ